MRERERDMGLESAFPDAFDRHKHMRSVGPVFQGSILCIWRAFPHVLNDAYLALGAWGSPSVGYTDPVEVGGVRWGPWGADVGLRVGKWRCRSGMVTANHPSPVQPW